MFSPNFPQAQAELCRSGQAEITLRPDAASSGRFDAAVDVTAADWLHCNARGGRADRSAQDPNSNSAAEGLAAKRAKAVGAVSQATGQLHGALQGVDAVETMVADV